MVHDRRHSRSSSASGDELEPAQQDVQPRLAADEMEAATTLLTVGSHNQPAEPYVPPLLPAGGMATTMDHASSSGRGRSSSRSDEAEERYAAPVLAAEQYVSPLSAADMVALATSLLAHPHWGPSLKKERSAYRASWSLISRLKRQVLVACPHLAGACATGVALALLALSATEYVLWVKCEDADDEAVAAFYAALEQSTCKVITKLYIEGAAFGTSGAAACLGRCLNVNSTIQDLTISVDGFCGQAVWTAFSHALTSNATLGKLKLWRSSYVQGSSRHIAATSTDWDSKLSALKSFYVENGEDSLEDMEGWGIMLKHNSTVTTFVLTCSLPHGDGLLAPIFEALLTNTTLLVLAVSAEESTYMKKVVISTDEDMDVVSLAAMLRTNQSLRCLNILDSNMVCNRYAVDQGFLQNTTLEDLCIHMDVGGAEALMTALGAMSNNTSTHGPHLKSLELYVKPNHGFPSALVLGNMLASNGTLTSLNIQDAPYSNEEWATFILPALAHNNSLEKLDLSYCEGVDGGLVFDALLEVLESNTCIQHVHLHDTPLDKQGKAEVVDAAVQANAEYGAALKNVPTIATTSCRLVLCGYPFAGKSTILQTLTCRHSSSILSAVPTERTRGIDIQQLMINDLNMWVWDFAGQREFHPLQDFIFPTGSSVHAATAFVFTFDPISNRVNASQVCLKGKQQFQQEFSYWLGFICSNSKPRPSCKYKPLVLVAVTHKDKVGRRRRTQMREAVKEWVRDVAKQFKDMVTLDARHHVFFVNATDQDDMEFIKFEREVISSLRNRISSVPNVPTVCDAVAKALGEAGGQQLEPIISFHDFRELCKSAAEKITSNDVHQQEALINLFNARGDKGCKAVAAYLRDAGEILYFSDLDFIVRNPRWFAHGILGHLIEIFPEESEPAQDHAEEQSLFAGEEDMFKNGLVTKDFLTDVLGEAVNEVGLNPQGTNTDQLIILMEKLDLCYKAPQKYLIPALFKDEHRKAEKGECKRNWELRASSRSLECICVNRRLLCSDPVRTFITPGFFPRLQVVLKNMADEWGIKCGQCKCILKKGFCQLIFSDIEIMVESSGYFDYFVDIMLKSYRSQLETIEFLETDIISSIRRLCASPKGCQGVTLVEAIIRPDCVVGEDITLCRFRQCVKVATLEQQIVRAPDSKYRWDAVKDEHGKLVLPATSNKPQDLLDPNWIGWRQEVCYPDFNVHHGRRRGVAVIVSMVKYNNCRDRSGGREDEANLKTLAGELQFEVKLLRDSRAGELIKQLKEIAATSICAEDESFLCFVMGHGDSTLEGTQFMLDQDGDMIMLEDIVRPFRTCQHLQDKPKVFFVISCRGGYKPLAHPQPQVDADDLGEWPWKLNEGAEVRYLYGVKDWLMVFSTAVGAVSARYSAGTPFVKALFRNFNHDKRQTMDVLGILNDVKKEVSAEEHSKNGTVFGQCAVVSETLIKRLYWKSKAG